MNWSKGVVPGDGDIAVFRDSGTTARVDAAATVGGIFIDSSFTGKIDLDAALTVAGDVEHNGGTIQLDDHDLRIGDDYLWSDTGGGVVTATTGSLVFDGASPRIQTTPATATSGPILPRVTFDDPEGNFSIAPALAVPEVSGLLTFTRIATLSSPLRASGGVVATDPAVVGNGAVILVGSGAQTLSGAGDFGSGGILVDQPAGGSVVWDLTRALDGPLHVFNTSSISGMILVGGAVKLDDADGFGGGTLRFEGAAAQKVFSSSPNRTMILPGVQVAKTGTAKVTFANNANVMGDFAFVSGGGITWGTKVATLSGGHPITVAGATGTAAFGAVVLDVADLTASSMMVKGLLTLQGLGTLAGNVAASGNVTTELTAAPGGSGTITLDKTTLIDAPGSVALPGQDLVPRRLPALILTKSGKVTTASNRNLVMPSLMIAAGGKLTLGGTSVLDIAGNASVSGLFDLAIGRANVGGNFAVNGPSGSLKLRALHGYQSAGRDVAQLDVAGDLALSTTLVITMTGTTIGHQYDLIEYGTFSTNLPGASGGLVLSHDATAKRIRGMRR